VALGEDLDRRREGRKRNVDDEEGLVMIIPTTRRAPVISYVLRAMFTAMISSTNAFSMPNTNVIDSHLHIWAPASDTTLFPYDNPPPPTLQNLATPESLIERMNDAGVDGALIVQPINHKFDHSFVTEAIQKYPHKFKGMLLHDPSLSAELAVERVEQLVLQGYVGVRFNPYLWPTGELMSNGPGLAVYKRCGEMNVPVGVMCFKGLGLHFDDILALIENSPNTILILDHFGFCALDDDGNKAFEQLLKLAIHPNVIIKISAMFRNTGGIDSFPYDKIKEKRFMPLLGLFGTKRLMMGSDFPYVLETEGSYKGAIETVRSWVQEGDDRDAIMGGNAERLFGSWSTAIKAEL
jgi:predicted TIM-barrel fold metal-dependent hydrolase